MGESGTYVSWAKEHWPLLVLALVLGLGFFLRVYHAGYPVIGYHNWKETHYLTEARNFADDGFFEHGFFVPEWDYPRLDGDPSGSHSDTFPTLSILVGLAFMVFGPELWVARGINILFTLGSILFFYAIIKHLSKREDLALTTAAVMAFNPLLVFFGRQVQLINPGLFFSLAGVYGFLRWKDEYQWWQIILTALGLGLGTITKYYYGIFLLILLPLVPWRYLLEQVWEDKRLRYQVVAAATILFLCALWVPYMYAYSAQSTTSQLSRVDVSTIVQGSFWQTLLSYGQENYTLWGVLGSLLGLVFFYAIPPSQEDLSTFITSYLVVLIPWFVIMANKLSGHSYHQYPAAPLILFFLAYTLVVISNTVMSVIGKDAVKWWSLLLLLALLFIPANSTDGQLFDTQFHGLDVAGEYLKEHKQPGDRVMHSAHQAFGLLWHADMKGTRGIPETREDIRRAEDELNASWLFVYQWDIPRLENDAYLREQYTLEQAGVRRRGGRTAPVYFLFSRGETNQTLSEQLSQAASQGSVRQKTYETTRSTPTLRIIETT